MQGIRLDFDDERQDVDGAGTDRRVLLEQENVMPVRPVVIGCALFVAGLSFLFVALFVLVSSMEDIEYWWPGQGWLQPFFTFLGLGLLCFLPGFYVVRILVCILRGYQGGLA